MRVIELGSHSQLLLPDLVSRVIVGRNDSLYRVLGSLYIFGSITNNQHVLIIIIVWLRRGTLLLRAFSSDQDLAAGLFLKSLLIETFRANQHAYVVDSGVLGKINLLLNFGGVLKCAEQSRV
jgi:hypothetical protein